MASIGFTPISKLRRDVSPHFQAATDLPDLPDGLKEVDSEGYKKYDADIREWWTSIQENLGRMQDQVLTYAITDLDSKHVGLSTAQSSDLQSETGVINQNISDLEAAAKANIVAVLNNQYSARTGTAAEWTSDNPTLADAEIGLETDTSKVKIGDGATAWNALPYFS